MPADQSAKLNKVILRFIIYLLPYWDSFKDTGGKEELLIFVLFSSCVRILCAGLLGSETTTCLPLDSSVKRTLCSIKSPCRNNSL